MHPLKLYLLVLAMMLFYRYDMIVGWVFSHILYCCSDIEVHIGRKQLAQIDFGKRMDHQSKIYDAGPSLTYHLTYQLFLRFNLTWALIKLRKYCAMELVQDRCLYTLKVETNAQPFLIILRFILRLRMKMTFEHLYVFSGKLRSL